MIDIISACNGRLSSFSFKTATGCMAYQTTVGWSLVTSGIVSLLLAYLPGDSMWWGLGLLIAGIIILYIRRDDLSEALEAM